MAVALTPSDKKEKVWKEERKQFLSKTIKK